MPVKKSIIKVPDSFGKRAQDKLLSWSLLALVGVIVWLYLQDRDSWKEHMAAQQEKHEIHSRKHEDIVKEMRENKADVDRRLELAIERHGRMREDITAQNERISRQWEMISEVREKRK